MRLVVLLAAAAAAIPFAAAALTSVTGGPVGSGSAALAACDPDGFSAAYSISGGTIAAVMVNGIADPACDGAAVRVAVVDSSGAALATGGPVPVTPDPDSLDGGATVPVGGSPAATNARRVEIVLEGP